MADHIEPYDDRYVQHVGSVGFLRTILGADAQIAVGLTFDQRIAINGLDGHAWEVWGECGVWMSARRLRTPAEHEAHIDHGNGRRTKRWFSVDRQDVCAAIAGELMDIAENLRHAKRGSNRQAKQARRRLRARLEAIGKAQWRLTTEESVTMPELRTDLAAIGLEIAQRDYFGSVGAR